MRTMVSTISASFGSGSAAASTQRAPRHARDQKIWSRLCKTFDLGPSTFDLKIKQLGLDRLERRFLLRAAVEIEGIMVPATD